MSKQKEIKRLIRLLQEFSLRELKALKRQLLARRPKKIRVSKAELRKFVKQNR